MILASLPSAAFSINSAPSHDVLSRTAGATAAGIVKSSEKLNKKLFLSSGEGNATLVTLRDDQQGKQFQVSAVITKADDSFASYRIIRGQWIIYFSKAEGKIQVIQKNIEFRAAPGSPEKKMLERSHSDSPLASLCAVKAGSPTAEKLAQRAPDGPCPPYSAPAKTGTETADPVPAENVPEGTVFLLKDLLIGDAFGIAKSIAKESGVEYQPKDSRILGSQIFSRNMNAQVQLVFMNSNRPPSEESGYGRDTSPSNFFVGVSYSMVEIPSADDYQPRKADPRVGYYQSRYLDFSDPELKNKAVPAKDFIIRWKLEKLDPSLVISDVKDPITYWIDETVPLDIREDVKKGILSWNAAFEAIGFRNAIEVKEVDSLPEAERKKFDAGDNAYDVIVGVHHPRGTSYGPARWMPGGRIFKAAVMLSETAIRGIRGAAQSELNQELLDPSRSWANYGGEDASAPARHSQEIDLWANERGSVLTMLRNQAGFTAADAKRYVSQAIQALTGHETGHTLGLGHNMECSRHAAPQGGDVGACLMDYDVANIPVRQKDGTLEFIGPFFRTEPGAYDRWAVKYGYKPLSGATEAERKKELAAIAEESRTRPELSLGNTVDGFRGDVDAETFDLRGDPLVAGRTQLAMVRSMWKRLDEDEGKTGSSRKFKDLARAVESGFYAYYKNAMVSAKLIGGVSLSRQPSAGINGADAVRPVPRGRQEKALRFLMEEFFNDDKLRLSPRVLRRIPPGDSFSPHISGAGQNTVQGRLFSIQKDIVTRLLHRRTQENLAKSKELVDQPSEAMPLQLVFENLDETIWTGVGGASPSAEISDARQELQTHHVQRLLRIRKGDGTREGLILAKHSLRGILAKIDAALADPGLSTLTRGHLEEIKEELDLHFSQPVRTTADLSVKQRFGFTLSTLFG